MLINFSLLIFYQDFQYYEEGKDQGVHVREKSKASNKQKMLAQGPVSCRLQHNASPTHRTNDQRALRILACAGVMIVHTHGRRGGVQLGQQPPRPQLHLHTQSTWAVLPLRQHAQVLNIARGQCEKQRPTTSLPAASTQYYTPCKGSTPVGAVAGRHSDRGTGRSLQLLPWGACPER